MCPNEIKTKSINDSSIRQSSTEKKESFKHWYLRHLFADPIIFIILVLLICVTIILNMVILILVGKLIDLVVSSIGDIDEGLSLNFHENQTLNLPFQPNFKGNWDKI